VTDAPASAPEPDAAKLRVGFLGPSGTFTEQALRTEPDLAVAEHVPMPTMADVLRATETGEVDVGFVAIENSIEGTVNVVLDTLAFDVDVLIQREVVMSVQQHLLALPGTTLADLDTVVSIPHATAQCRGFLQRALPGVTTHAANSTAEAARQVADDGVASTAAIGNALAAELYGLEVLAADIEDHPENHTRFLAAGRRTIPAPTGHDKTSLVLFQWANRPGSLQSILGEFAARGIDLTKLESRPTKQSLGDYCFIIDLEGHIADEVVADALRALKARHCDVKFLGSYPRAGEEGAALRQDRDDAWRAAEAWLARLQARVLPS